MTLRSISRTSMWLGATLILGGCLPGGFGVPRPHSAWAPANDDSEVCALGLARDAGYQFFREVPDDGQRTAARIVTVPSREFGQSRRWEFVRIRLDERDGQPTLEMSVGIASVSGPLDFSGSPPTPLVLTDPPRGSVEQVTEILRTCRAGIGVLPLS